MVSHCCVSFVLCRLAAYPYGFDRVLIALSYSSTAQMAGAVLSALFKFHGVA